MEHRLAAVVRNILLCMGFQEGGMAGDNSAAGSIPADAQGATGGDQIGDEPTPHCQPGNQPSRGGQRCREDRALLLGVRMDKGNEGTILNSQVWVSGSCPH
jgi:hypothetical protein